LLLSKFSAFLIASLIFSFLLSQNITLLFAFLPTCLIPTFIAGIFAEADSIIPLEELPIKNNAFL